MIRDQFLELELGEANVEIKERIGDLQDRMRTMIAWLDQARNGSLDAFPHMKAWCYRTPTGKFMLDLNIDDILQCHRAIDELTVEIQARKRVGVN